MSIFKELIEKVESGYSYHIDFKERNMKIGNKYLIKEGVYDNERDLINSGDLGIFLDNDVLENIEMLFSDYKRSVPSQRSDNKRRKYFKALTYEELEMEDLVCNEKREIASATLEGYILCMILLGKLKWDKNIFGGWFWQSKTYPELIILRDWIEEK